MACARKRRGEERRSQEWNDGASRRYQQLLELKQLLELMWDQQRLLGLQVKVTEQD